MKNSMRKNDSAIACDGLYKGGKTRLVGQVVGHTSVFPCLKNLPEKKQTEAPKNNSTVTYHLHDLCWFCSTNIPADITQSRTRLNIFNILREKN